MTVSAGGAYAKTSIAIREICRGLQDQILSIYNQRMKVFQTATVAPETLLRLVQTKVH